MRSRINIIAVAIVLAIISFAYARYDYSNRHSVAIGNTRFETLRSAQIRSDAIGVRRSISNGRKASLDLLRLDSKALEPR